MSFNRYYVFLHNPSTGDKRSVSVVCDRREYVERLVVRTTVEIISKVQVGGVVDRFVAEVIGRKPPSAEEREAFYALVQIYMGVVPDAAKAFIRCGPQLKSASLQSAVCRFEDAVTRGADVAVAMKQFKGVLPDADLESLLAGREVGGIAEAVSRLQIRSAYGMTVGRKVKKAVWYPMILMMAATVAVSLILAVQMPEVANQFKGFGVKPTGFSAFAFQLGEIFNGRKWLAAFPPILMLIAFTRVNGLFASPRVQRLFYRAPALRTLIYRVAMADCISTYAMLRRCNVNIMQALEITSRQTILLNVRDFFLKCRDSIGRGEKSFFNAAMKHSDLLGPDGYEFIQLLKAGEESGANANVAERLGSTYQRSAEESLDRLSTLLEPVLLIFCGCAVGFVMLLTLLPMAQLNSQMLPSVTNSQKTSMSAPAKF